MDGRVMAGYVEPAAVSRTRASLSCLPGKLADKLLSTEISLHVRAGQLTQPDDAPASVMAAHSHKSVAAASRHQRTQLLCT